VIKALGDARVGWVYGGIGVIVLTLALVFKTFTALGHAEQYLPAEPAPDAVDASTQPVGSFVTVPETEGR
jgi:hypothetical protein